MGVRLTGVFVYPLKSARGIALDEAVLEAMGLRWDRRWMVVDAAGRMVTQRTVPRMALVETALVETALEETAPDRGLPADGVPADGVAADGVATDGAPSDGALVLTAPGLDPLRLPLDPGSREGRTGRVVSIWSDEVRAMDTGDQAAAWISEHLGMEARIVWMPDDGDRAMEAGYATRQGPVTFVDAYPLLLISGESLDGLNQRLEAPLPMDRFRPNLVVRGAGPHAEDGWRRFCISDVGFEVVKPCARCAVTTTDQRTGERGKEPLRTLAEYRTRDGKVLFGQNVVHAGVGRLRVGEAVEVISTA